MVYMIEKLCKSRFYSSSILDFFFFQKKFIIIICEYFVPFQLNKSVNGLINSKVNSALHPSRVDQMSIRNSGDVVVKSKLSPGSGSEALRQLNPIEGAIKRGHNSFFFFFFFFLLSVIFDFFIILRQHKSILFRFISCTCKS